TTTRSTTTPSGLNDVSINYHQVKSTPTTADLPVTLVEDSEAPDRRCCIKIPWKHPTSRPPPNFKAAYAKDCAITRRLSEEQKRLYAEAIDALVKDDIVEELSEPTCIHYVTALPVFRADKPTHPCRVCLDAREFNKYVDVSAVGGNGEGSLWFFLLAWRTTPFYECADLKQAFLKVALDHPTDTRFTGAIALGRILRFRRMPFGFGHSPHGLRSSLNWHRRQWQREVKLKAGQKAAPNDVDGDTQMINSDGPVLALDVPVDTLYEITGDSDVLIYLPQAEDEVTATVDDHDSGDNQEEYGSEGTKHKTTDAASTREDPPQDERPTVPSSIDLVLY
ncbi:hypothetical protein FOZ63_010786, partial [Perkinsus olseni]